MPHAINIEADVVWSKFWGDVTIEELRAAKLEITEHRRFRREFSHIIDVSAVVLDTFPEEALREFEKERSVVSPLALQIVVVPAQGKALRFAQALQTLGESGGRSILIAFSEQEARSMLRLARPGGSQHHQSENPESGALSLHEKRRA